MGRRSIHTAEELRELILTATSDLIETEGFAGLSAREIARRIGYSPGTLYNVFDNLDDLVLTIEGRLLDRLSEALSALPPSDDPLTRLKQLTSTYIKFTHNNPKLWNLLFEHHLQNGQDVPAWYMQKLETLYDFVEFELGRLFGGVSQARVKQAGRVIWSSVHGITSLSTNSKLSMVTPEVATEMVEDLIDNYIGGLRKSLSA